MCPEGYWGLGFTALGLILLFIDPISELADDVWEWICDGLDQALNHAAKQRVLRRSGAESATASSDQLAALRQAVAASAMAAQPEPTPPLALTWRPRPALMLEAAKEQERL